jgi:hypothetical protein
VTTVQDEIDALAIMIAQAVQKEDTPIDLRLRAFEELVAYAAVLAKVKDKPGRSATNFGALRDRVKLVDTEDRDDDGAAEAGVHTRRRG